MRHRKAGRKLNMSSSHRQAMFRNMVTSLLKHDRIRTTDTRAKELRPWVDHMITLAKRGDLHARRQALAIVREKDVVHKLFEDADKRFGKINGGYTRITKVGRRPGDAATVSIIELIAVEDKPKKKKKKSKAPKKVAATAATAAGSSAKADKVADADDPGESKSSDEKPVQKTSPEPVKAAAADDEAAAAPVEASAETEDSAEPVEPTDQVDEKKEDK